MKISESMNESEHIEAKKELLALLLEEEGYNIRKAPVIAPRKSLAAPPLSFAQQRLWFLDQLESESALYNIYRAVRLTGLLDVEALQRSLDSLVARHEALRTTFASIDGRPIQVITETRSVDLTVIDLGELQPADRETELRRLCTREAKRAFDLSSDLMMRVRLFRLEKQEHVLIIVMHHISSDGWSMDVFYRELSLLYEAFSLEKPYPLPELPVQYADFAVWQRQWLQGEVLENQLAYWKQQLDGVAPVLELPSDRPRPVVQTYMGAKKSFSLKASLVEGLKALSHSEGATLFMTLLAAFKILLHRYTAQDDMVIGSPIANRNRTEIEGLIGFFVNTLVIRTDLSGQPSFRVLLQRVREVALEAYAHQDLPFEKLVEELQPERDLSRSPLFQVMFALQNVPRQNMELTGLSLSAMEIYTEAAKFDLSLFMWETADGIKGALEYSTDLFEAETIVRMIGHFQTLLEGVAKSPDQRLSDLQILTEAERKQMLIDWNDTSSKYPRNRCIHQLFEEQVEQSPDAVAVVYEDEQLTYWQLNARSNQLAHYLKKLGVGPEVLVGVCLERSVEMVIGLMGILKAGGAYVPLDPSYPKERLNFILNDTRTQVLLTEKRLLEVLLASSAHVVCLDTDRESIEKESTENPASMASAENLAYVIYTSGSTGRPKGISITHSNAIALLYWAKDTFNSKDLVGVLASTSICFDLSVFELFFPLSWGGKVIMAENVLQLIDLPSAKDITLVNTVPSAMAELLRIGKLPDSVRTVNLAGEVLKNNLVKQIYQAGKVSQVLDLYGPSEDTTYSTFALRDGDSSATIGRAISNTQIYILDRNLQAVPIGVAGEMYIGGDGLARGYLNRPDLTAEKFIPNPFSNNLGERLYKTGDFARYLLDGNIEFLSRMDEQVKIRGFRIELGEIEAALGQHSAIRDTVVIAREDAAGDKRLVAYVVPKIKIGSSVNELHNYLKKRLPNYMVPSVFVVVESLPLMPNGKVDRRALSVPDSITYKPERAFIAPRDNIEFQLVQIWEDILNVRPIGVRDNFFDIGGHSLLAMRLMSQIKSKFGKKLPVATLYKEATIEYLAVSLRQQTVQLKRSPLIEIKPTGSKLPFYCVHPVGGNVYCYLDLARTLGTDQPFYGLQHPGLDGWKVSSFTCIEEIAGFYVKSLMAQQPEGPYLLGGWSMGGLVAFEMAQQLSAQGHKIALLALFDTQVVGSDNQPPELNKAVLLIHFAKQLGLSLDKDVFSKLEADAPLGYILSQAKAAKLVTSDTELSQLRRHVRVYMCNIQAVRMYKPKIYAGRINLFTASQRVVSQDESLVWHKFATGGVATYKVPGDHYTMMQEPQVQVLSERLRHCMDNI